MAEMEMPVYNVELMGPVVQLTVVKRILQDLADHGHGVVSGIKLNGVIRMLGEIADVAANETPVRLRPSVPGGRVEPFLASIEISR